MNRRSTLLVLLLFLLPLTVPLIPAGPVTLPSETDSTVIPLLTDTPSSALASPVLPEGPTKVAGQYEYDGLGAGRSTQEYALGTNTSLAVTSLNYSANNVAGGMRLPAGWTGYRMQANISNLYDQLYWVTGSRENGNYESGGAIATNWTRVSNGMGYPTNASGYLDGYGWNYGYHGYGGLDIGYGGTRGVQAWVEFESGWAWDASKYIAWENNVTIPRDSPTYARLTFRYQADLLGGSSGARGRMVIYVYVAGRTYSQIIPDDELWHQATVSIPDDDLATWPQHGSILVRLGLSFTSAQSAWDWEYWGFNFDNVQLEVRGKAQPKHTWLQLWMNSTAVSNGGSYGLGTVTISGTWTNPGTTPLRVVAQWWTASSSSVKVDFTYNLTLYIRRTSTTEQQMPPDGSSFWVRNTTSVYWSAWFYAYQPYYFQRYNLTIQRPSETWTLVKATDPQFVDRTSLVETNSTHFRLPYTSFYDYGWWNFNFTSTNRVSSLTLNSKSFQIAPNTPNTLTVTATLGLSTGVANLTLYNASGSVVKQEKKTVSSTSVSFTNIVFNTDNGTWFRPGVYTLCVSYANGLTGAMTAAGFKSALITVKHGSASVVPELQTYQVTRIAGTYFYPRVQYYDNDTAPDSTITGATVVGNWTGTNTFNPAGTWYEGRLAADAKVAGNYTLRVNATLAYYGDAYYNIKVVVLEQTALSSPDSPGMTQPYNKQVSVRFYFKKVYDGTPITGATVTSDWPGAGTPTAQGNGWYNFTIDTAQVAKPGTYYMMVTAKKLNHQQQSLTLTIVVRERDTLMTATSPTTVPINGKSQFNVTLSDNDASGAAITNATNRLHLQVWRLGQRYWSVTTVQLAAGKYNVSIDTTSLGAEGTYTFVVNFTWYGSPNNQPFYGNRTATVYVSVRKIVTKLDYTAPDQQPWGNSMNITVTFLVDDPASSQHGSAPAVSTIACTLNGSALTRYVHYDWQSLGGGNYKITIYASRILDVALWQLQVQVTPANSAMYTSASRTLTFRTRAHQTQVVVDPPAKTAFGFSTPMTVRWLDLDKASANVPGNLTNVVVSNCPVGGPQTFGSLSFTLVTTSWSVGVYTLTVTVTPSLKWYQGGSAQVNVEIRIHYTSVVVQPPVATAWGFNTPLVIQWTDLDTGGSISAANLKNVTVTNCPVGGNQVFTGTLTPTLATSTWSISAGYVLTVNVYAVTSPSRSYNDVSGTVTVVVRMHRVEVVVPTPAPTPWGSNTAMGVTWKDLDTGGNIAVGSLKNITVTGGPATQTFTGSLSFTLASSSWARGSYALTVAVYPTTSPQQYDAGSAPVTLTIRVHYTSVTISPPPQMPWGNDTNLVVTWRDTDTSTTIPQAALVNITVTNCPVGGNQVFFTLSFKLVTKTWSVGSYALVVWMYGNASYAASNGPVTVTIRSHQTQTVVSPPSATPFGFNTPIIVSWLDIDKGGAAITGNLSNVVVSGGPTGSQTFFALSFTLVTNTWNVGNYSLTVTISASTTWYQGSSSSATASIRIHYTSVVVEAPAPTAWGFDTPLVIHWTDLDTGSAISLANLKNVTVTNCPVGGNQVFTGTLTPTLVTNTWSVSAGYVLTVKLYAVTSPTRSYTDASGTVTVVIRMHRVEVVVPTPAPTPWGSNTAMSVTWRDLDTGATIAVGNLKNITVTNGPTGTQTFTGSFTFNLITSAWSVGSWSLTVTVYPTTSPQRYEVGSGTVTVTIRAHYVSVTVDPPQAQPKGSNTPLVVHWRDVDTSADIAQGNLLNVTVKGTAPGLPYMATLLSFNLPTSSWSVGSYALTAWVYANSNLYGVASGPVTVTIRAHATRLDVVAPSATPWGHYTHVELKWWDIDVSQYVTGNLKNITLTNCPDLITHTHYSLAFDLDTRTAAAWAVGSYVVTVTLYSSSADYQNAAAPMAVTIRIHYSNVVVQPPSLTAWGTNTPMTVEWRDLDEGNSPISPSGNLINVTVRKSGTSPQSFFSLAFTLLTSSMPPWNIGSHTLNVTVYAVSTGRKYSDQWSTTILTIRGHRVTVVVTPPPAVPYEGSFTLAVQWKDIDTGGTIAISYLNYVRVTGNYSTYPNLPMTRTSLTFPVSTVGWARVDHLLNVTVYPLDTSLFDTQWTTFTVVLRKHNIGAAINPIASIPYSNDTWFTLTVSDADTAALLSGSIYRLIIVGATTRIYALSNWTTYVKNVSTGVYSVKLLSGTWTLGSYSVQVTIDTVATLNDGATSTPVTIRQLFTAFTYTPSSQVPWDENGTLIVLYKIADLESRLNLQTLNGSTITVDGLVSPTQYAVTFLGAGVYRISFKAGVLGEPGPHPFTARSSAGAQYQGGTLSATMTVRRLLTMLTYSQIPTAPYGDPVIARVQYLVFDGESLAHNGQPISSASITATGLAGLTLVPGVDYNVAPEGSLYRITITKSLAIASYHIRVNATHSSNRYFEASISDMSFNVRTVYSEIVLEPIAAAAYDENFAITVIYRVRDDGSSQNGQGIPNADQLTVTTNGSWTLGSWSYVQGSAGYYIFTIDSGLTAYTGRWWVNITLGWAASPPRYDEKWVGGWLVTTERPTRVSNTFPANTGYADVVKVYLNYTDIVSGWGIDNATKGKYVRIVVLNSSTGSEITATYWVENVSVGSDWLEPSFFYRISITASELGAVNVIFTFDVSVSWVEGHTPFYTPASTAFSVRIVGTETVLYSDAIDTQPTGDDVVIYLHYNTTGALPVTNGTGLVGIQVGCAEIPSWDHSYWYVPATSWPGTNGLYALIIRGSKNLASGSYTFRINMTWPTGFAPQYAPYYSSAGMIASARVRLIQTTLEWSQPIDVYWSQALVINVWYVDYDHNQNITGVTWAVTGLSLISAVRLSDGTWVVTIDTTGQPAGPVSFLLTASKTNYYPQVRDIDVQIMLTPLVLQFHDPTGPLREVYWGQWINITVYLENDLTDTPIIGGQVIYQFYTMPSWALMEELGNGYYNVYLDSSPVGATGTQLTAQANMTNYNRPLLLFAVNIKQVDTVLELLPGDVLAPVVIVDDFLRLNVSYWAIHPITHLKWYAITGAGVTAYNGTNPIALLTHIGNGSYRCSLDTSTWHIQPVQILVSAYSANTVQRSITFSVTVAHKPCDILPESVTFDVQYNDTVDFAVFLNDRHTGAPVTGHNIYFVWAGEEFFLVANGTPGWYVGTFQADQPPRARAYDLSVTHEQFEKYGYTTTSLEVSIARRETDIQVVEAWSIATIDDILYRIPVPFGNSTWRIPKNDTLRLVVRFIDYTGARLSFMMGAGGTLKYFDTVSFTYDLANETWYIDFLLNFEPGERDLILKFTLENYEDQVVTKMLNVINIPMQFEAEEPLDELVYIGFPYTFRLFLNDTYHNGAGVQHAKLNWRISGTLPTGAITWTEDAAHPGYYIVTLSWQVPASGTVTFEASKNLYQSPQLQHYFNLDYHPTTRLLMTVGTIGAVILAIAIAGWALWARVFSIPWEVRRLRSLAKKVEHKQGYELSRKDRKHFRAREVKVEDTVGKAMTTVGVPVTAAMLPTTKELVEVSATEEDLMGELDKIPGLGAEEKAVLAQEMRKIPRKDRIWFLDDLRRQMGERRMDFLTTRTPTPAPAPAARAEAAAKPALVEAPKPVTAKPGKPKEKVEKAEKPEKPKERVAPTVRPREEHVAPPPTDALEVEIRRELDKIPGLTADEKTALLEHLRYLTPEERRATYQSLRQTADK